MKVTISTHDELGNNISYDFEIGVNEWIGESKFGARYDVASGLVKFFQYDFCDALEEYSNLKGKLSGEPNGVILRTELVE